MAEIKTLHETDIITNEEGTESITIGVKDTGRSFAVDVRRFFVNDDGEWQPTSKGIWIPLKHVESVVQAVQEALEEASSAAEERSAEVASKRANGAVKKAAPVVSKGAKRPVKKAAAVKKQAPVRRRGN